ncbi:hypothetical protein BT69DRAFT_1277593 [Atractiella rhizophila]|nr:hypothetical protein BT69DRAFT_1277593 [Atractiella rhizophila]
MICKFQLIDSNILQVPAFNLSGASMPTLGIRKINQLESTVMTYRDIRIRNVPVVDSTLVHLEEEIINSLIDLAVREADAELTKALANILKQEDSSTLVCAFVCSKKHRNVQSSQVL